MLTYADVCGRMQESKRGMSKETADELMKDFFLRYSLLLALLVRKYKY
jgi:hypothetical protein